MLQMFYPSVMASVLFFVIACWGSHMKAADAISLNRLAGSVVRVTLDVVDEGMW